jgi:uncharacterized protein (TIGR03084 family)
LQDFGDEAAVLDALLASLGHDDWLKPTPAEGWDIRDSVVHLAIADEMALECVTEDRIPEQMRRGMEALPEGEEALVALEASMVERGRTLAPAAVHTWWRGGNDALRKALAEIDVTRRLPWGPNVMSRASFVTARLMETWAHGLDCFDAAGVTPVHTDRLRHVADIGLRSLPYALLAAGMSGPGPVRLELTSPSGETWNIGPPDAPTVISGSAADWCLVAVHRDRRSERTRLRGQGPDAEAVLRHVKAYL